MTDLVMLVQAATLPHVLLVLAGAWVLVRLVELLVRVRRGEPTCSCEDGFDELLDHARGSRDLLDEHLVAAAGDLARIREAAEVMADVMERLDADGVPA